MEGHLHRYSMSGTFYGKREASNARRVQKKHYFTKKDLIDDYDRFYRDQFVAMRRLFNNGS